METKENDLIDDIEEKESRRIEKVFLGSLLRFHSLSKLFYKIPQNVYVYIYIYLHNQ